jgi:hypothetical protein
MPDRDNYHAGAVIVDGNALERGSLSRKACTPTGRDGTIAAMLVLFEVLVAAGQDPDTLLSDEVLKETQAQVMKLEEARALGFSGVQPDPKGRDQRLIAVAARDAQFIQRRLEMTDAVQSFRVHQLEV